DSARHCQLWRVEVAQAPAAPVLEELAQRYELPLADGPLQVVTLPGVFSHGRLDVGTALLLEHLDGLPSGPLLDFGCGVRVLGPARWVGLWDNRVRMLDVGALALASSRLALRANDLDAELVAGDGSHAAPAGLAAIVTKPPFHQGVHTNYQA